MPTTFPVPISFRLPDAAWEPVVPESLGVSNAAFLAVRRDHVGSGYAPTITISGDLLVEGTTLEQVADEAVSVLSAQAEDVRLRKRTEFGSEAVPGVMQQLDCQIVAEDGPLDIRQLQAIVELTDVAEPTRRAVAKIVLSTTRGQHDAYLPEFQEFLRTVRPGSQAG